MKACRSHSLSPYSSPQSLNSSPTCSAPPPPPPPPPSSSPRSTQSLLGEEFQDFRKGFSVDNQGFLDKPSSSLSPHCPEDQRRHSIEVCLPQPRDNEQIKAEVQWWEKGVRAFPVRVQSVGGCHRKKKMSPPCISIHPPPEREHPHMTSPPELADCNTILRRRTPSFDRSLHTRSNTHTPDITADAHTRTQSPSCTPLTPLHMPVHSPSPTLTPHGVLAPSQTHTPLCGSIPTQTHTPMQPQILISPNIFIQPHEPSQQATSVSPVARHINLPQFTFDQPDSRYVGGLSAGLSDAETTSCSSPFDSRLESGAGFSAKNRRTAQ